MICKNCGYIKKSKFCNYCKAETPTHYDKELIETLTIREWLRNLLKSKKKVGGKSSREIEQYVGNKDFNFIS